ncbi:GGDEF domain-containing protein [Halarcobacter anaerophilus]|uniref:diguanylate cyclase n=1 Tax=Halarcobacter anaerophilus TaxID=877500 RepID=A0A4Q0Y491_9BACT|nr:GGDEF domain-containing protein [Halarcobacter anaerophilus]QDF30023.1 PBP2 sensor-containing diguanylate cyclase [Halarcobacter anaerophilus]RXJ63071.1 hypothetical protein CRV06_07365 [Halarcobacter anaerophilus]
MEKLFLLLIILIFPFFLSANDKEIHKVAVVKNWEPYYFVNENGKPEGYAIELFEKVAKSIDLKYEYIIVDDFDEVFKLFEEKKADIIPNIGITQSRENLFLFTQETDSFFINIYKKTNATYKNIKDLKDKKIGVVKRNICNKLINKDLTNQKIYFKHFEDMLTALKMDKIDAFCYPQPLIEHELTSSLIVPFPRSIKEIKRGIGVSKAQFHLLPKFNEAITQLKLDGEYKKIYEKWFGKKSFIQLSKSETIFLIITFFGVSLTTLIVIFYFLSKKRWLITKDILQEEIKNKTNILKIQNQRLKTIHRKLKERTYKDGLTNIYNRKFFNEKLNELLSLYKRYEDKFSFLIFDIDDFKAINDTYGHAAGDKVLIDLTSLVSSHIRANDYFFRVGGEEFVVLLSQTSFQEAQEVAQKIRIIIEKELNCIKNRKVTVSIGLTEVNEGDDIETIYKRADSLLYKAKNRGKNRVVIK